MLTIVRRGTENAGVENAGVAYIAVDGQLNLDCKERQR